MSRGWLIVFAKAPRPGLVKTRLSPPLSLDQCAELYSAMLADILEASARFAKRWGLLPVLAFHPPDAAVEMVGRAPPGYRLQVQRGADLGERMANAFAEAAASGANRIVLRGSDSPALEASRVDEAMDALDAGDDLVLTPDQSGGYAMIGMRTAHPALFETPMSTEDMLDQTLRIAAAHGLRHALTAPGFDLDEMRDFHCFEGLSRSRLLDTCPRTVQSISDLPLPTVL